MKGLTLSELKEWNPPRQPYIIDKGVLPVQGKLVLYGRFSSWKSILTIDMAFKIANGKDWFGFKTTPSKVFVLQTETPQAEERKRILKYTEHCGLDSNRVWFASEPYIKLDKGWGITDLEKEIARCKPDVIILDPLYTMVSGKLVDLYDMSQLFDRISLSQSKFNYSVVIVHHPRKDRFTSEGESFNTAGDDAFGTFIVNWCDTCIRTIPHDEQDTVELRFEKVKNAEERLKPFTLQVDRTKLSFSRRD